MPTLVKFVNSALTQLSRIAPTASVKKVVTSMTLERLLRDFQRFFHMVIKASGWPTIETIIAKTYITITHTAFTQGLPLAKGCSNWSRDGK